MKIRFFTHSVIASALGALTFVANVAAADNANQFFESNTVDNFTVPVVEKQGVGFQFFIDNEARKKGSEEIDRKLEDAPAPKAIPENANTQQPETKAPHTFASGSEVLNEYGDPNKDVPVLAQDNAPKPFKAMMAAFEAGDDQLAYGYARQWVRYMDNLKKRTDRVVEAARAAQTGEKLIPGTSAEANRMKQMIVNDNANLEANLDPRAQQILAKAKADEGGSGNSQEAQELKVRQEIRKKLIGKVPVDPKGQIDIYVFLAPNSKKDEKFTALVNQFHSRFSSAKKVNFAGFSSARLTGEALARERQQHGLSFDLIVGDAFAKELQIKSFPAIIFVSPSTGKILKEVGDKPFIFYDELVAVMQGRVL